jgi:UDP-N-acetylglucosamine--N-acetylmuramyl-(pentapeptide) pyrophosphoryl-undecaprenol N-acetylglucosamine transferase
MLPEVIAGLTVKYSNVRVVHQTGKTALETVKKAYIEAGCDAEVTAFIDDIGSYYRAADLVICRAGALTLAELAELGKASILVPFPYAAHDHQVFNARAFAENGAALIQYESELEVSGLSNEIENLITHREKLTEMGQQARKMARPEAREQIVQHCLKLIQER